MSLHVAPRLLTPHPGEFRRLIREGSGQFEPGAISAFAASSGTTVIYKNSAPVVTDGQRTEVTRFGTSALATAGTGDVLTGICSVMLTRFPNPFDAALVSCFIHGRAGTLAGKELTGECVIASDLFRFIPVVMKELIPG
jgi:NAD(P)H-hydrate epimerase